MNSGVLLLMCTIVAFVANFLVIRHLATPRHAILVSGGADADGTWLDRCSWLIKPALDCMCCCLFTGTVCMIL
jgi:hypothetical protein